MPFLPSSGALSINDIRNLFGGPGSPSMANYYRGGAFVPSTKTVTTNVREPASGSFYTRVVYDFYSWQNANQAAAYWGGGGPQVAASPYTLTSLTTGGITYFRDSFAETTGDAKSGTLVNHYRIFRTYTTSSTVNINTGVPTSGTISIGNFYGAEKP